MHIINPTAQYLTVAALTSLFLYLSTKPLCSVYMISEPEHWTSGWACEDTRISVVTRLSLQHSCCCSPRAVLLSCPSFLMRRNRSCPGTSLALCQPRISLWRCRCWREWKSCWLRWTPGRQPNTSPWWTAGCAQKSTLTYYIFTCIIIGMHAGKHMYCKLAHTPTHSSYIIHVFDSWTRWLEYWVWPQRRKDWWECLQDWSYWHFHMDTSWDSTCWRGTHTFVSHSSSSLHHTLPPSLIQILISSALQLLSSPLFTLQFFISHHLSPRLILCFTSFFLLWLDIHKVINTSQHNTT